MSESTTLPRLDKEALLTTIQAGRDRLDAKLAQLPDAAMNDRIDQEWTRKDVLAHLEAWERRVVDLLEALRGGGPMPERAETDELNARYHAESRDRSLEDVRSGERAAYARMQAAIRDAQDEELFDAGHFGWTEGEPFANWFRGNGDEHYEEHLEQLTRPAR
jgi:hypothetical protein